MANIMIMGDSWAMGEWGWDGSGLHRVTHPGAEQYLGEAGHRVYQLAQAGSSNREQVDRLRPEQVRGMDHIIWFLTDPIRDIHHQVPIEHTLGGYHTQREHLIRAQFDRVRHLPMHLIGGVCAVPTWVAGEYPGFTTVVPDLRTWLLPDVEPCETLCRPWQYPDCDPDLLTHWEQDEQVLARHLVQARFKHTSGEHQWFWPDGQHPNRAAHHRLTHELILPAILGEQTDTA